MDKAFEQPSNPAQTYWTMGLVGLVPTVSGTIASTVADSVIAHNAKKLVQESNPDLFTSKVKNQKAVDILDTHLWILRRDRAATMDPLARMQINADAKILTEELVFAKEKLAMVQKPYSKVFQQKFKYLLHEKAPIGLTAQELEILKVTKAIRLPANIVAGLGSLSLIASIGGLIFDPRVHADQNQGLASLPAELISEKGMPKAFNRSFEGYQSESLESTAGQ